MSESHFWNNQINFPTHSKLHEDVYFILSTSTSRELEFGIRARALEVAPGPVDRNVPHFHETRSFIQDIRLKSPADSAAAFKALYSEIMEKLEEIAQSEEIETLMLESVREEKQAAIEKKASLTSKSSTLLLSTGYVPNTLPNTVSDTWLFPFS